MATDTECYLISLGLHVWARADKRRIYINPQDYEKIFGLCLTYFDSGNIRTAYLNGQKISNTKARKLIFNAPYYDCIEDKWVSKMDPII